MREWNSFKKKKNFNNAQTIEIHPFTDFLNCWSSSGPCESWSIFFIYHKATGRLHPGEFIIHCRSYKLVKCFTKMNISELRAEDYPWSQIKFCPCPEETNSKSYTLCCDVAKASVTLKVRMSAAWANTIHTIHQMPLCCLVHSWLLGIRNTDDWIRGTLIHEMKHCIFWGLFVWYFKSHLKPFISLAIKTLN